MTQRKTPSFWYRAEDSSPPLRERLLGPVSALYRLGYAIHHKITRAQKVRVPVLCIGNLVAGGTGKTPTALALMDVIHTHKLADMPHFLLRGYGGAEIGPLRVDLQKHTAWETGDEALLLARGAPTIVSPDRVAGAKKAMDYGADLILMDDGLQNPGIEKDSKIAVINGEMGFGNQKILPAGPLRQTLAGGLKEADAFILIGKDKRNVQALLPPDKPVIRAYIKAVNKEALPGEKPFVAFAGLGYPEKFFSFLKEDLNLDVVETIRFPDHYPYTEKDLKLLHEKAQALGAELLTTEKDLLRLPAIEGIRVHTLPIRLVWDNESEVLALLKNVLAAHSS